MDNHNSAIDDHNDISANHNKVINDTGEDLNSAESKRNAKMTNGFKTSQINVSRIMAPTPPTKSLIPISKNIPKFPWFGPFRSIS